MDFRFNRKASERLNCLRNSMPEMDYKRLPECAEKSRLMDAYSSAIGEFSRCAQVVNARMGVMYKGDFDRLSKSMAEARVKSENAHRALLAHVAHCGC